MEIKPIDIISFLLMVMDNAYGALILKFVRLLQILLGP